MSAHVRALTDAEAAMLYDTLRDYCGYLSRTYARESHEWPTEIAIAMRAHIDAVSNLAFELYGSKYVTISTVPMVGGKLESEP